MLTADQISALRDRSEQLLDPVTNFLIEDITRRVKEAGQLTGTASYQTWRLQNLGMSQRQLKKEIAKRLEISLADAEKLLTQAAETGYNFDISRFPNTQAIPLSANSSLQQILEATVAQARADLTNMTQTMGFVGADDICRPLTQAYQQACDFAFQKISTGAQDYVSAIRDATWGLAEKGIRTIDYKSGYHISIEAAVRQNMMGGMGIMQNHIAQENHDTLGCNGWEISAHEASAPDHEPIQGKQYSDAEYEALNNSLARRIGTLHCGHYASPIILGVHSPQYTEEELEDMRRRNEEGVTFDGRHYTGFEATQRQRKFERSIRKQQRRILVDETAEDTAKLQTDQIRLQRLKQEYKRFSEGVDLPMQYERLDTAGFTWKHAKAAEAVANDPFINPPDDLEELSAKIDKALNTYSSRSSKWSGKTVVMTREQMPKANGRKEWNCDISLRNNVGMKTVVHEHLHARSVSYFDPKTYLENQNAEEGAVEFYAQEICKKNGVEFKGSYSEKVKPLHIINNILRNGDRYSFAKQLFDIPLPSRYNWLREQADQLIATGKLSKKTVKGLNDAVEFFRPVEGVV